MEYGKNPGGDPDVGHDSVRAQAFPDLVPITRRVRNRTAFRFACSRARCAPLHRPSSSRCGTLRPPDDIDPRRACVGRCFDNQTKAFFGALAFSDVNNTGQHEGALVSADWIESDLDRHFSAILTPPKEIAAGAHHASRWRVEEVHAMS